MIFQKVSLIYIYIFHMNEFGKQFFLQLVIINAYSFQLYDMVFSTSFFHKYEFFKVS